MDAESAIRVAGLLGVAVAAWQAFRANVNSKQVNDAVNHSHETGTPRLYDLVIRNDLRVGELLDWKRGYDGGPFDSGQKVKDFMAEYRDLAKKLQDCESGKCPTCEEENQ